MAVVKWTFFDATVSSTYEFAVNPNEGGTPALRKTITYQNTAAPGGKVLIFEGRDEPKKISFGGVLLEEAQLVAFETWFDKRHQIKITDDLGRENWVYITNFEAKRERARSHPWKHSYSCEATVLDVS